MTERPLQGARILVPPSRPEVNPLAGMLSKRGATVLGFPRLQPRYPRSWASTDAALRDVGRFDWIVFSGSNSVHNWVQRAAEIDVGPTIPAGTRLVAIGHGAVRALRVDGRDPDLVPDVHVAEDIARGMGTLRGADVLLVRVEGATDRLVRTLRARGARVTTADGYQMAVEASLRDARSLARGGIDLIALANPTTVRFLVQGAAAAKTALDAILGDAAVAAVGAHTARDARGAGMRPALTADGHIAHLAEVIARWWPGRPAEFRGVLERAQAFIGRYEVADAPQRAALRARGTTLVRDLRGRAMELGMSRGTENSPDIGRCEDLATEIEGLAE